MRFSLIGYGKSTREIVNFILKHSLGEVFVSEKRILSHNEKEELRERNVKFEDGKNTNRAALADVIVYSPAVRPDAQVLLQAKKSGAIVMGELEFTWRYVMSHHHPRVVAITGSNGKTTTVSLLDHILNMAKITHFTGGNIGTASASYGGEPVVLLEVSSFQLMGVKEFHATFGAILNISPNHLDWHKDMQEYVNAKMKLSGSDVFFYNKDNIYLQRCKGLSISSKEGDIVIDIHRSKFRFNGQEYNLNPSPLKGIHNFYNMTFAMVIAKQLGIKDKLIQEAVETFKPLEHRQELFAMIDGVKYVNDSKSTTSASTIAALKNFSSIVLILGGKPKERDYSELVKHVRQMTKFVVLMGDMVPVLRRSFSDFPHVEVKNMQEAVEVARKVAKKGDTVLLSPAATSYDMFENYEERGRIFKRLVNAQRNV